MKRMWTKVGGVASGSWTLARSVFQAAGAFYLVGVVALALGVLLIAPTMSRVAQIGDPILLLGAPIVMNGLFLFAYGIVILALARMIQLLTRLLRDGGGGAITVAGDDGKVVVRCPGCGQRLRVDRARKGTLACPTCSANFPAPGASP